MFIVMDDAHALLNPNPISRRGGRLYYEAAQAACTIPVAPASLPAY